MGCVVMDEFDPRDEEQVQELPHSLEAEQALLGAIFLNNNVLDTMIDFLEPDHFSNLAHRDIYTACIGLFSAHKTFNTVTLKNKFKDHEELAEVGGGQYLSKLAASAITTINAIDYARHIQDLATRRNIIEAAQVASKDAFNMADKSGAEIVEETQIQLQSMHSAETLGEELVHISKGIDEELADIIDGIENGIKLSGITSGLRGLDAKTGGFGAGNLIILAGRPAMGKTAVALNIAKGAAKSGYTVAFFSIEMPTNELRERLVSDLVYSSQAPIKYFDIKNRNVEKFDIPRLKAGFDKMRNLPLFISDRGGYTVESIRRETRRLNRTLGGDKTIDLMVVDYLQLMHGSTKRQSNRVLEIGEITGSLKRLAKELNIPILLLSQLSRALETRDDKRPILSDLRDSGSIEQDADTVIFVYRDHYYLERMNPKKDPEAHEDKLEKAQDKVDLIIGKQRRGPTGLVKLDCFLHSNAVRDGMNDRFNGV